MLDAEIELVATPARPSSTAAPPFPPAAAAIEADRALRRVDVASRMVALGVTDAVCAGAAGLLAAGLRFGDPGRRSVEGVPYWALALGVAAAWPVVVLLARGYEGRILAAGADLYRRAANAWIWLVATIAFASFALRADLSRGFVATTLPAVLVLSVVARYTVRKTVHRSLGHGGAIHRAIVVGDAASVRALAQHMRRAAYAGFAVVAVGLDGEDDPALPPVARVRRTPVELVTAAGALGADTIAVAGAGWLSGGRLRRLAWQLKGTGIQLVVAPALTDVAGPRVAVRPVDGLPLLHVDEPRLAGARRVVKEVVERAAAVGFAAVLAPLLAGIWLAIRLSSPGPVVYRQQRVGRDGRPFLMWKFRTMVDGADGLLTRIEHLNDADDVLFKMRRDPRVTPVGRWLRRHSLDELPQLWNVVRGEMSLVGPRPPLQSEVERYGEDARRRLLVKPGMTGLWQVSGRNDLSWDETVRLDLYYVENWSVALDALVLWKTISAVIHGKGAY
ncbi:MAG TPA: sugar transferase [Candidatus Dormibacteraeota bacterium]|nr:sugar transferase [Candidatus Dormibacteraeota bacterium]